MNYGKKGVRQKKKQLTSTGSRIGSKLGVNICKILLVCTVTIIVACGCVVAGMVKGIIDSAPDISTIDVSPTGYATKIYDNKGNEIQTLVGSGSNRVAKSIDDIPLTLQRAFVVLEDERFYEHNGIDIRGIIRAASEVIKSRSLSQGGSTITQQLLKNNVFNAYNESTSEKIKRKIQEQYLAIKLETTMSKEKILENYLNTINLGNGYLGVQAAANGYFDKDVSELTISECAVIASITQNPTGNNPINYPEKNQRRQRTCLENLRKYGYISEAEYQEALADDVYARIQDLHTEESASTYSYFVDEVIEQLSRDLQEQKGYTETQALNLIYKGGLSVYSTQDSTMQNVADSIINDPENWPSDTYISISYALTVTDAEGKKHNYSQLSLQKYFQTTGGRANFSLTFDSKEEAQKYVDQYREAILAQGNTFVAENLSFTIQPQISFSLMDQYTGYVKVIVGGRGDKGGNRTLNRATSTTRQPGSSIKPLAVYGPALDVGAITLASAIDDAPYYYQGEEAQLVTNYEKDYLGLMSIRTALKRSRNVPAVKVLTMITPQVGFTYLQKLGISTLVSPKEAINGMHDVVQSLALGGMTKGVTNIDMTAAYAAIANKGTYTKPVYYTQVYDHSGNLIIDNSQAETKRVFKETTAWLLTNAMEDVIKSGTGTAAAIENQPVAGKTGTTNADGDIWFCGFTPYYTASIWIGFDDNTTMRTSKYQHRQIWSKIMTEIHKNLATKEFELVDNIIQLDDVCSQSGKLAVDGLCYADPRGSQVVSEYFSEDNQPKDSCDTHVIIKECNQSHMAASAACPSTTTRIYIKKPASNVLNPEDAGQYPVADAEYAITDNYLSNLCSIHSKAITVVPTSPQSTTQSSAGSSSSATKPQTSTQSNTTQRSTASASGAGR
ncbi:MAG: PBP1A family penicillin-binding protein [Clostridia bacterium]|nr:PBP1A family penicillin-binding protein [Clostridia bacterium]